MTRDFPTDMTRRAALLGAAAEMMSVATTRFKGVKLGNFEVTTLLAGTRTVPDPQSIFA